MFVCIVPVYLVTGFDNRVSLVCRMCECFWNSKGMEGVVIATNLLAHYLKVSKLKKKSTNQN